MRIVWYDCWRGRKRDGERQRERQRGEQIQTRVNVVTWLTWLLIGVLVQSLSVSWLLIGMFLCSGWSDGFWWLLWANGSQDNGGDCWHAGAEGAQISLLSGKRLRLEPNDTTNKNTGIITQTFILQRLHPCMIELTYSSSNSDSALNQY